MTRPGPVPVCTACGGDCWTDGDLTFCRDCGQSGFLAEPPLSPRERYSAQRRLDKMATDVVPEMARAWSLSEGDQLEGGAVVVSVYRNPIADEVMLCTNDGEQRITHRDTTVAVVQRAVEDVTARPGWRVGAFTSAARRLREAR